jgi:hypothetical protein
MEQIVLLSGLTIANPLDRLERFCAEEYVYYDGIPSSEPNDIEPLDVLATVSVNSFVNSATQVRRVHRGLAAVCDPILAEIPEDADLLEFDQSLEIARRLLHAAVQVRGVLVPVAVKVLHRKRRNLIPMLDNVLLKYYLGGRLPASTQNARTAAAVAIEVLKVFRADLRVSAPEIRLICAHLSTAGYKLSPVRALEILVWTQVEPVGYYRRPWRLGP